MLSALYINDTEYTYYKGLTLKGLFIPKVNNLCYGIYNVRFLCILNSTPPPYSSMKIVFLTSNNKNWCNSQRSLRLGFKTPKSSLKFKQRLSDISI